MRRIVFVLFAAVLALTGCSGSQHHSVAKDPTQDIENNPNIPDSVKGHGTTISPSVAPTRSGKVCQILAGEKLCTVYVRLRIFSCPKELDCHPKMMPVPSTSTLKDGSSVSWVLYSTPDSYTVVQDRETLRQIVKRFAAFEKVNDPTNVCVFNGSGSASKQITPKVDAPLTKGTVISWC